MPKRKRYSPEYKHALVELVRRSKSSCRRIALEIEKKWVSTRNTGRSTSARPTSALSGFLASSSFCLSSR